MKRIILTLIIPAVAAINFNSCSKIYTREDYDKMTDKTFYLLPLESTFKVPAEIASWREFEENISTSVIKGVKELDVLKFKESVEKRYGIIVDTSYFEKARSDPNESIKYFRALKYANATGSNSFTAIMSTGYDGYLDSLLYTEIAEIKKTKPCIIISHDTVIEGKDINTEIKISLFANDESRGTTKLSRSMSWILYGTDGVYDVRSIDYKAIYEALSKITEYKYNEYTGFKLSGKNSLFLDGSM